MIPKRNLGRALRKAMADPAYAFSAFRKRLRSAVSYHLGKGKSAYPETISLFLTYLCNLRCKMCAQWGEHGTSKGKDAEFLKQQLTFDEIRGVLNDVAGFKPNITLFGGEPLICKHWDKVVQETKRLGMRCNMVSNCTLLKKNAARLVEAGLDEIIWSLDGPGEVHNAIRGATDTFERASEGIKAVIAERERAGAAGPKINVTSVIFEENYRRMEDTIATAREVGGASITFHHLIFMHRNDLDQGNEILRTHFNSHCADMAGFVRETLPEIDPEYLVKKIREIQSRDWGFDVSFYPNYTDEEILRYYRNYEFTADSYKPRCQSPWNVAYVLPDGEVRPCQSLNFSAGNVREHTFRDIWNNDNLCKFRRLVKECGKFPVCSRCTELYRF